ncbi:MAG: (Fe-S)-binding protein [bacterium]
MRETTENRVADPGLDETIKKLTPETIQAAVQRVLTKETAARLKVYLDTCVHCGLCADACHTFVSRDKDPLFAPVSKVKQTLWRLVDTKGRIAPEELRAMARIVFTECGVCRRCSMYCPFGIDIAYLLLVVRRICSLLGVVPLYLQDTTNSHSATMNQMWVNQDEWID